jgi:hypothetical protein
MANNIVTVVVSQTVAAAPNTLQQQGAFISQGGTTLDDGATALITQLSELTAILVGAVANTSLVWSGGTVTVTTSSPHGLTVSDQISLTIAGVTPTGYNGTYLATITGTSTFTYALGVNPGSATVPGTWVPASRAELLAMGTTYFAQGNATAVYVLELGAHEDTDNVGEWVTFITDSDPQEFYAYTAPEDWAANAAFLAAVANYNSLTSKVYVFVEMSTGNYTGYDSTMKCVVGNIAAPLQPATAFLGAAGMYQMLSADPSSTNKVAPFAFRYLFGVTAYPTKGNAALLDTLKAAGVNYVGTGAEGGITNLVWFWGTSMDGRDLLYWYSVDWVQINLDTDLANAVINGSNNPTNPLYYNQDGINRLKAVAQQTLNRAIAYGMALGPIEVTATPFIEYVVENPSDYSAGIYKGLAVTFTPARGFKAITFNLQVSDFPAQ